MVICYTVHEVINMEVGKRIRAARKNAKLTQAETAQRAGIAINSLRLYEGGKRTPNVETLGKIATALGVRYFDLLDCESEMEHGLASGILTPEDISEELNIPLDKVLLVLEYYHNKEQVPEEYRKEFESIQKKIVTVGGMLAVELAPIRTPKTNHLENEILSKLQHLNDLGLQKVLERIEELSEVPKYTKEA
ncbi:MAG: helix-turn-helix transcriptional regulator [Fibrobacter sp.]|nr:helix-turn-helix transcriptional regulator [Fibrobacter sp.]